MRHRGAAQRRQVDPVQRHDHERGGGDGELPVLHHRAQCRPGHRGRCPARRPLPTRRIGAGDPHLARIRRHRRPRQGGQRRPGAGQQVPRPYPRGRCHRPPAALLRILRYRPSRRLHRPGARRPIDRDRAFAGRPRKPRAAPRSRSQEGPRRRQGRQPPGRADRAGIGSAARGDARKRRRAGARGGARFRDAPAAHRQAGALCLQRRRRVRRRGQRPFRGGCRHGGRAGRRNGRGFERHRGRDRPARRRVPRGIFGRAGARRDGPRPGRARRLPPARSDYLLHRRAQGGPRLDDTARRRRDPGRGHHPQRLRTGLYLRRDHRLR